MQSDGNLVIYDQKNNIFLTSNTNGLGYYASLDNDGSLTLYDAKNNYIWYDGSILSK